MKCNNDQSTNQPLDSKSAADVLTHPEDNGWNNLIRAYLLSYGLPVLISFLLFCYAENREKNARQEELREMDRQVREDIRNGVKVGEALKRLYGEDDRPKKASQ